ncbi:hypothetical protein CRM22_000896 [Opisthorchis felineus]|uniref:UBC core domain-containing protein n=2 Tax=Opisthorchis felineus TaxID=147828 RepID=A0A4S2MD04_OPIFE|nr:hypothetical protein CRM22_000896 [Opisthorchis felineus]
MQRSFLRDYLKLTTVVGQEFKGQVELLPVDENTVTSFVLIVRPKKGFYAHGAFRFMVTVTEGYPRNAPSVSCLNPPWHPNIDPRSVGNNICLNILSCWSKENSLKSMVSALVFLFYEPNFEDPVHFIGACILPEERDRFVRLSLAGGNIDSVYFQTNEEWCHWAAENSLLPAGPTQLFPSPFPSVTKLDVGTQPVLFSVNAPTELQHQVSSLSTYYQTNAPIEADHFDRLDLDSTDVSDSPSEIENAFLHHITVQQQENSPHSIHERAVWHNFIRYYYAEVCSAEYHIYLSSWLHESFGPTVAQQLFRLPKPLQKTELGVWNPFYRDRDEVLAALRRFPRDHTEDGGDTSSVMPPETTNGEESVNSHEGRDDQLHTQNNTGNGLSVCGVDGGLENSLTHMVVTPPAVSSGVDMNELQAFSDVTLSKSAEHPETVLMVEPEKDDAPADSLSRIRASEFDEFVVTSSESKATPVSDSGDSQPEETISQSMGGDTNGTCDDFVAVFDVGHYEGAILLKRRGALRLLFSLLRPFWWVFYQTRWPPFLAPGYVCIVGDELIKCFGNYFYPASAFQLMFELYNHRMRARERTSLILVDPLALSPLSPVLNRVVLLPSDAIRGDDAFGEKFACLSIEWIAPAQSFSTCFHRPTEEQFPGFTILSVLSLLSNWLAYLSRIELRGIVVGYSQYRDTYTVRPMGIACMYPATLGCGQLPLLDAWPLQLLIYSARTCCSTLVYLSSRLSPRSNFPNPRLLFSFTDVDNL